MLTGGHADRQTQTLIAIFRLRDCNFDGRISILHLQTHVACRVAIRLEAAAINSVPLLIYAVYESALSAAVSLVT